MSRLRRSLSVGEIAWAVPPGAHTVAERQLPAGTAAERVVSEWTADAKARAVVEQAVRLLQAHASSKEASLS